MPQRRYYEYRKLELNIEQLKKQLEVEEGRLGVYLQALLNILGITQLNCKACGDIRDIIQQLSESKDVGKIKEELSTKLKSALEAKRKTEAETIPVFGEPMVPRADTEVNEDK